MRDSFAAALRAALIAMTLLAAGCADMGGLATGARTADASALAAAKSLSGAKLSPAAWPRADWWKAYQDPQLDALIEEALKGSPTLRIADARMRRAQAAAQVGRAALAAHLDAGGAISRQRFPSHGLYPPPIAGTTRTQPQVQATLGYEIDPWGRNRAAYESALGRAHAAELDAFAARLTLSAGIAQAYVQLERAYLQLDVAAKTLAQRERFHALTEARYRNGVDTLLAVRQAEAALPATREQIEALHESIALSRNQIAALLGEGPDRGLAIARPAPTALPAPALPTLVPAELIGRRPDLVAQRWRIEAASRDIEVAKAKFYPNLNLAAFIGLQSLGLPGFLTAANRTPGVSAAFTLPVFDAGRLRGGLAGADADYDAAVELYNQTLADALREVVDQLATMKSIAAQRREQALAEATARQAYELALLRFKEGIGNYLEVISAETGLLAQQSLEVDLRARALGASINLARALGGGLATQSPTGG